MSSPPPRFSDWVKAARPLAQGNIAPPILFGVALGASHTHVLDGTGLILALGFGVLDHLVIVLFNDRMDEAADRHAQRTWVSGGSGVLAEGRITGEALRRASTLAAIGLLALSSIGALHAPALLPLAIAALGLLWLYSGTPVRLSYRGGGALLQGLGVGAVLPLVGIASQRPDVALTTFFPSLLPSIALGVAGNLYTAIPDAESDAFADKRTLASQRGPRVASWAAILVTAIGVVLGASTFASSPTEAQLATWIPLCFLTPSLLLLRGLDASRGVRLRLVLLGLATGTSALLCWSIAVLTE